MLDGANDRRADTHIRVEDFVGTVCQRKNKSLHKFNRKLARVLRLLDVVILYIWKYPNIARILPKGISRKLSDFRPLEVLLVWIFRWHPDGIEIECVVFRFCEP